MNPLSPKAIVSGVVIGVLTLLVYDLLIRKRT